jgi:hypothetical protein
VNPVRLCWNLAYADLLWEENTVRWLKSSSSEQGRVDSTTTLTTRSTTSQSNHTGKEHIELLTRIWSSNEALLLRNSVVCTAIGGLGAGWVPWTPPTPLLPIMTVRTQGSAAQPTLVPPPSKRGKSTSKSNSRVIKWYQHNLENTLQMKHLDPVTDLYKSSVPLTCPENWIESPEAGEHNRYCKDWYEQAEEMEEQKRNRGKR